MVGGLVAAGLLLQITRASRGFLTKIWQAKRTGLCIAIIPFYDSLPHFEMLTEKNVKDGVFKYKERYSWFIIKEGVSLWFAGVNVTILVPDLCFNMTLAQLGDWVKKKVITQQYTFMQPIVNTEVITQEDGTQVEKQTIIGYEKVDSPTLKMVEQELMSGDRVPNSASATSLINKAANMMFSDKLKKTDNNFLKEHGGLVLIILAIILAIVVIMTQTHDIKCVFDQAPRIAANATELIPKL
jgi:hypothetical protein